MVLWQILCLPKEKKYIIFYVLYFICKNVNDTFLVLYFGRFEKFHFLYKTF